MSPEEVTQAKFPRFKVLYNDDVFSIAWGIYDEEPPERLAMRWNGEPGEHGYPCRGKYPVWFMLPEELSVPLLKGLCGIESESAKRELIVEVLKRLQEPIA
jgi:hypothetical protein